MSNIQPPISPSTGYNQDVALVGTNDKTRLMLSVVQAGFGIFPTTRTRTPCVKGWQDVKPDPLFDPAEYQYGYGIAMRPVDFVLDWDPRRDEPHKRGEDSELIQLWKRLELPKSNTLLVETGRDGLHVYLRKPAETQCVNDLTKLGYPSIEIKSAGRYVIGPGSPHPEGHDYRVIRGAYTAIEDAPEALLNFCLRGSRPVIAGADLVIDDEITVKRFIKHCKTCEPSIKGAGGDGQAYRTACIGKNMGLSQAVTLEVMRDYYGPRCTPVWDNENLDAKVAHAYEYSQEPTGSRHPYYDFGEPSEQAKVDAAEESKTYVFKLSPTGKAVAPSISNAVNFFRSPKWREYSIVDGLYRPVSPVKIENQLYGLLRKNEFTQQVEFTRRAPWHKTDAVTFTDGDHAQLKLFYDEARETQFGDAVIWQAIDIASSDFGYHPVKQWLESITWDGVPRLNKWLPDYCGTADDAYTNEIGKNTIIGAVARIFTPGCQHDTMLILEGVQGIGKSSAVRILGGDWYRDIKIDPSTQGYVRTVSAMRGGWIIESSEMEVARRADVQALKSFLTLTTDIARLAYGHNESILPRQSVFIGTTNPQPEGYFRDTTGNRRFLPVYCRRFDLPGLQANREQIFAEAVYRFRAGEAHHITDPAIEAIATGEQRARMQQDHWVETIGNWINEDAPLPDPLTTDAIAVSALNLQPSKIGYIEKQRINAAIKAAGFELLKTKRKGVDIRVWVRKSNVENWL